jgi:hypothetical protein
MIVFFRRIFRWRGIRVFGIDPLDEGPRGFRPRSKPILEWFRLRTSSLGNRPRSIAADDQGTSRVPSGPRTTPRPKCRSWIDWASVLPVIARSRQSSGPSDHSGSLQTQRAIKVSIPSKIV